MSEILLPNVIVPECSAHARELLMDLHGILQGLRAELFYRKEQRAMLLMVSAGKEVWGNYRVIALLKSITPLGPDYLKGIHGVDPVLQPNQIRPSDYSQAEDIIKAMHAYLFQQMTSLVFDVGREGMAMKCLGVELALVRNITRYGAEVKGKFSVVRIPPRMEAPVIDPGAARMLGVKL